MRYCLALFSSIVLLVAVAAPGLATAGAIVYDFALDTDPGWTATGSWRYGAACNGPGACVVGAHSGTNIYGNAVQGSSRYASPGTLTTTALDCSGLVGVRLGFWRNLGLAMQNASYLEDYASIEVSSDGSTWTTIWQTQSGQPDSFDTGWTYQQYDISPYADKQPTVYVRWTLGPIDAACGCMGFNIDDVQITADTPEISVWLAYASWSDPATDYEVWNTVRALGETVPHLNILWASAATDAATLESDLEGKQVLIIPEQELTDGATLEAKGAEFAFVLQKFVLGGGTVIVCSDFSANGFLSAAGLMQTKVVGYYGGGQTLTVAAPDHPLAAGVSAPTATNSTMTYAVPADTFVVVTGPDGNAVVAERQYGAGAVILLGYDYYEYDAAAANVLGNAVRYPGTQRVPALVYQREGRSVHTGQRALDRLRTPYSVVDSDSFTAALGTPDVPLYRSVVVADDPCCRPAEGWDPLINYINSAPVPVLVSTWGLDGSNTGADGLASACGVASTETLLSVPPVYDWTGGQVFTWWESVPSPLTSWNDGYMRDADRLSVTGSNSGALAGFDSDSPVDGNAAIVAASCCKTMIDGFLWDDGVLDADGDGRRDVQELVTNQLALLLSVPDGGLQADVSELTAGGTVNFANCCPRPGTTWCYNWYPESLGSSSYWDGCPATGNGTSYTYTSPGFFFPVLEAWNGGGAARATTHAPIAVGFPDTTPGLSYFRPIIACVEEGVVKGFGDGTYKPTQDVKRDAMAVYVARAMCGGEDYVPIASSSSFSDVDLSSWALNHIEYCYANGVVTGFSDGTYHPDWFVNRGQMAAYVARAISDPTERPTLPSYTPPVTPDFPDVATDNSYYKYIEYLYQHDIVTGFSDGTYQPARTVTRGQMAIYVQRAFGYETYAP